MDFMRSEIRRGLQEENYKGTDEQLMVSEMDAAGNEDHASLIMEQMQQVIQNSLTSSSLIHNFQIPISPRLMLKSNLINRNMSLGVDISQNLSRNLLNELDIPQHINRDELSVSIRRNISDELDITQVNPNLNSDVHLPHLSNEIMSQNVSRIKNEILSHSINRSLHNDTMVHEQMDLPLRNGVLPQTEGILNTEHNLPQHLLQNIRDTLRMSHSSRHEVFQHNLNSVELPQNLSHNINQEVDLSHLGRNLNLIQEDERRCLQDDISQRLIRQNLIHEPDQRQIDQNLLPLPFQIKSEQEEEGYVYDQINQGFVNNVNGIPGHVQMNHGTSHDNQVYTIYNGHINVPALAPIDLYTRHNQFLAYPPNNANKDSNPQNLVVHRQYNVEYPPEGMKNKIEIEANPKENLKPNYCIEANTNTEKNENDPSYQNKISTDDIAYKNLIDAEYQNIKGEYVCYKCTGVFPSKRALKQHSKNCGEISEQAEKAKFVCSQCPYKCQSPAILKIHERTHTGEKPFSCNFCDYKSGQKNNVAKHILVHNKEKPFRCQYCDYRCAQKNNLVVHERTHTGFKPFACPYCDYRTVQKPNLVKHMYLHTDQKPFSCDLCSYRCVQKTNLTKHRQRHVNEKDREKTDAKNITRPYRPRKKSIKCDHCPYSCVQKASLDKHVQFKHKDDVAKDYELLEGLNLMKNTNLISETDDKSQTDDSQSSKEFLYDGNTCQEKLENQS